MQLFLDRSLRYRFGHLSSSTPWTPLETPVGAHLASNLLNELNRHSIYWRRKRETAETLSACSWVVESQADAEDLTFLFLLTEIRLANDPTPERQGGMDLIGTAVNSTRGVAAESAMILATRWVEDQRPLPELLPPLLLALASDEHPAVRAILLHRLPVLQLHSPELGWRIFQRAMAQANAEMWREAELCLYYAYHANFDKVAPWLEHILKAGAGDTWGRIAALACLSDHIPFATLTQNLTHVDDEAPWTGITEVFSANLDKPEHFERCLEGLTWAMSNTPHPLSVVSVILSNSFRDVKPPLQFPPEFLEQLFSVHSQDDQNHRRSLHGFFQWLEVLVQTHVEAALQATEIMLSAGGLGQDADLWYLTSGSVLNRLFQEAEDREDSDGGNFLRRVIAVQDVLLKSGPYGLDEWLKDAERP